MRKMHKWNAFKMKKSLNTGINKLNWRFNYMFSDHKPGLLLYAHVGDELHNQTNIVLSEIREGASTSRACTRDVIFRELIGRSEQ